MRALTESLIEILLNAGAGEQPIQQFLGQMFFGMSAIAHAPCRCVAGAVLRQAVRGCSIPSVQDADFSETRRKIQLSADVWPARVARQWSMPSV